jgi:Ca2+-binding RTX toxin-like protein
VKVTAQLSDELVLVGSDGAECSGGPPIVCTAGDLDRDQQVTVRLVARAVLTGTGSIAARASSATADPSMALNAAGASISIQWRRGACANVFGAGPANDVERGTAAGDAIDGLLGNDILSGLGGDDCLDGGLGNDRLRGDDGNDRLDGGPGSDVISGGSGSDRIDGGSGNDRIAGDSGPDRIAGGSGNDSISAIDRRRDTVDCGAGRGDIVRADRGDRLTHCEKVVYSKTKKK